MKKEEKFILLSIPVMFLIGFLMHFIYEFTGENIIIGSIAPVNESIFEHIKLAFIPVILWFVVYYYLNKKDINKDKWFTSLLVYLIVYVITIPLIYYFYTYGLGIENTILHILTLLISLVLSSFISVHIYKYSNGINYLVSLVLVIVMVILFIVCTFNPPRLPLFYDKSNGIYGI